MYPQNNPQNQWDAMDAISVLSLIIGYSNLIENRQQSAQNDVQAANDKQAQYLLEKLTAMFESQNAMLAEILDRLDRILDTINGEVL